VAAHPHPVRSGKQPRVLFATQASTRPPRFVIFATGLLDAGYRRFIERRLREDFGFERSPISISVRVRAKKRRSAPHSVGGPSHTRSGTTANTPMITTTASGIG